MLLIRAAEVKFSILELYQIPIQWNHVKRSNAAHGPAALLKRIAFDVGRSSVDKPFAQFLQRGKCDRHRKQNQWYLYDEA